MTNQYFLFAQLNKKLNQTKSQSEQEAAMLWDHFSSLQDKENKNKAQLNMRSSHKCMPAMERVIKFRLLCP